MAKTRSVYNTTGWCHICGLPIPDNVVSNNHLLFGTVDHVVALSRGGKDELENRMAAHRVCNISKGNRDLQFVDVSGLHGVIKSSFERIGIRITRKMLSVARRRIGLPISNHSKGSGRSSGIPYAIQRWDWEGGFVGNRTEHYDE